MAEPLRYWTYKPADKLARVVIVLLSISIAIDAITVLLTLLVNTIFAETWNDAEVLPGEMLAWLLLMLCGVGALVSHIATVVVFCMWQYRVAVNARAPGAQNMEVTPAGNVYWWFVPLFNLVMPLRAMRENYNASRPEAGATDWATPGTPRILTLWWATWVISNLLSNVVMRLSWSDIPVDGMILTLVDLGITAISIWCFVLVVRIILTITRWQTQTVAELQSNPPPDDGVTPGQQLAPMQ